MLILFLGFAMIVVAGIVMVRVPFLHGRPPLALYDQLSAYTILGSLSGILARAKGFNLWIPGLIGLFFGVSAYYIVNILSRNLLEKILSFQVTFYIGSFVLYLLCPISGVLLGRFLLSMTGNS